MAEIDLGAFWHCHNPKSNVISQCFYETHEQLRVSFKVRCSSLKQWLSGWENLLFLQESAFVPTSHMAAHKHLQLCSMGSDALVYCCCTCGLHSQVHTHLHMIIFFKVKHSNIIQPKHKLVLYLQLRNSRKLLKSFVSIMKPLFLCEQKT